MATNIPDSPISSPAAWLRIEQIKRSDWIYRLSDADRRPDSDTSSLGRPSLRSGGEMAASVSAESRCDPADSSLYSGRGERPALAGLGIRSAEGASFIYREQLARYVPLRFAVRGRDLQSAIVDAKDRVLHQVKLLESAGQENGAGKKTSGWIVSR